MLVMLLRGRNIRLIFDLSDPSLSLKTLCMMKTILFPIFLLLTFSLAGQKEFIDSYAPTGQRHLMPIPAKSVPEIVTPGFFDEACGDTVNVISVVETIGGFVAGTNGYGDLAKVQRLIYNNGGPFEVLSVYVAFESIDMAAPDSVITIEIRNDITNGEVGSLIGTSDPVLMKDIALPDSLIRYTKFTFPETVILERDSFWVVVDMSRTYTENADYVSIFTSLDGCGDGMNAFEYFTREDGSLGIGSIFNNWNDLNIEMYLYAEVEGDVNVSTDHLSADYSTTLAPNPVTHLTRLRFEAAAGGNYSASLSDLTGRQLRNDKRFNALGTTQIEWDLSDLPSGIYVYHLDGPAGRQSGKVVKH